MKRYSVIQTGWGEYSILDNRYLVIVNAFSCPDQAATECEHLNGISQP